MYTTEYLLALLVHRGAVETRRRKYAYIKRTEVSARALAYPFMDEYKRRKISRYITRCCTEFILNLRSIDTGLLSLLCAKKKNSARSIDLAICHVRRTVVVVNNNCINRATNTALGHRYYVS